FSAFCCVIAAISCIAEEDCWIEVSCTEAPSASPFEDKESCVDAEATCRDALPRDSMEWESDFAIDPERKYPRSMEAIAPASNNPAISAIDRLITWELRALFSASTR